MSSSSRWSCGAILLLAAALRLPQIGAWSLDGDECYTWWDVRRLLSGEAVPEAVESHPLGFLGIAAVARLIGADEVGLRLFPALCGTAAVVVLLCFRRDVVPRGAALAAGLLAALSPWLAFHSQEARFYGPQFLCAGVATLAALPGAGCRPLLAVGAGLAALLCHPSALVLLPCLLVPLVVPPVRRGRLVLAAGGAALGLAALVWAGGGTAIELVRRAIERRSLAHYDALAFAAGLGYGLSPGVGLLSLLGGRGAWIARGAAGRFDPSRLTLLAAGLVPPALLFGAAFAGVSMHQRYAMASVPALLLLAGLGFEGLRQTGRPRLAAALLGLAVAIQLPALAGLVRDGDRHDWRAAAAWLAARATPQDILVADEHSLLELYLTREPGFADVTTFEEAPLEEARQLRSFAANRRDCWVVLKASRLAGRYGEEFDAWLEQHFAEVMRLGREPPPLSRHDNRLVVFHRLPRPARR